MTRDVLMRWLTIAFGAVAALLAVSSALYQIFHVTYETQANTAAVAVLRSDIDKLEAIARTNDSAIKSILQSLNEVETKICAEDDLRNLMHAQLLREIAQLHEKTFGAAYPVGNAFYPQVCRRNSTGKAQ